MNPIQSSKSLSPIQLRLQAAIDRAKAARALAAQKHIETIESSMLKEDPYVTAGREAKEKLAAEASASANISKIADPDDIESLTTSEEIQERANQSGTDRFGNTITYNTRQQEAITLISSGESCVVVGAAGTGKTTIQKGSTQALIQSGLLQRLGYSDHKHLRSDSYGIAICAYTRRATNNIRKNLSEDLQSSCLTIHKLLEYEPTEVFVLDADGNEKRSMRFQPKRNADYPLPPSLRTIVIEESSMVSRELFQEIVDACPHNPQFVFLGDIQQLPPVFGSAILGYKMLELPVVELTEVYRQALDSPIIALAHRILSGSPIKLPEIESLNVPGKLKLHPWKKKISPEGATTTLAAFFIKALDQGVYNPETDGILIPFNKSCGTDELNKHIATQIARKEFRAVYEIIHGWKRSYYSVGDKCLYEREDAVIKSIYANPRYAGMPPRTESHELDYWGHMRSSSGEADGSTEDADNIDDFLQHVVVNEEDGETKKREASHIVELMLLDSERTVRVSSAGDVDKLILGYAITVHKAQGSEWDKVFLCFHHSHSVMINRELLYTAVTRAKRELYCICENDTYEKGIQRQRIPGNDWQSKAQHFQGKIDRGEVQN